jgi:hypothetical protein
MKIVKSIALALALSLVFKQLHAQAEMPKGFKKGSIVLFDNTMLSGYIKDNTGSDASVWFMADANGKKKNYSGSDIISADIDGTSFLCINGDFFKVLCKGELNFLQKASDASGKVSYNGTTPIFSNGTEGKPGDYFIYTTAGKVLQLVSKKNVNEVAASSFNGYTAAIDMAKTATDDIAQLKEAVVLYNNRVNNASKNN